MELPDAALKIGAAGKWQHLQKDFFYRLVRYLNKIMHEIEYKEILDREKHTSDVRSNFSDELNLLKDLINYGTNLIPRTYVSSDRGLSSVIIIGVLLKQIVSMFDALEILISNANIHAAQLAARAIFEASVYLEWMIKENTDNKAKYYYVSNLRVERKWAQRTIEGTPEHESFSHVRDQLNVDPGAKNPEMENQAQTHLAEVNRILAQDSFKEIDEELERLKNKNRQKIEPSWYKPFQVHSLRHMAKLIKRHAEYDIFYSQGSEVTHAARYKDHIKISSGRITFKPIRLLEGLKSLLFSTISIVLKTYKIVLNFYRPGEVNNFNKKYMNEWRETFLNMKSVKYRYSGEDRII